jgi:hypothetical protein
MGHHDLGRASLDGLVSDIVTGLAAAHDDDTLAGELIASLVRGRVERFGDVLDAVDLGYGRGDVEAAANREGIAVDGLDVVRVDALEGDAVALAIRPSHHVGDAMAEAKVRAQTEVVDVAFEVIDILWQGEVIGVIEGHAKVAERGELLARDEVGVLITTIAKRAADLCLCLVEERLDRGAEPLGGVEQNFERHETRRSASLPMRVSVEEARERCPSRTMITTRMAVKSG